MSWTFQVRWAPIPEGTPLGDWQTSVKPFEKPEEAAAGAAQCQAILAINGVIAECRLVPHLEKTKALKVVGVPNDAA